MTRRPAVSRKAGRHSSGSLFRAGVPVRLAAAVAMSCLLWATILWAMA